MGNETKDQIEGWAILELMGHRRLGGYVREQELAGAPMIRIDIPAGPQVAAMTQFYSPGAIYCLTPTGEETARAVAGLRRPAPVERWELQIEPGELIDAELEDEDDFEQEPPL